MAIVTVNKGYQILEKTRRVDPDFAIKVLSGNQQFQYTRATQRQDDSDYIYLTRHIAVCPFCGGWMPAYAHVFENKSPKKCFTHSTASEWCSIRSLLDTGDKHMSLYNVIEPGYELTCMYCGKESSYSNKKDEITFIKEKDVLKVSCDINNLTEIINLEWAPRFDVLSFSLYETITFNFKRGTVYFELHTKDGARVCIRDVTMGLPFKKQNSKLSTLINNNRFVKKELVRSFKAMWGCDLPFEFDELNLQKFIQMTMFMGYRSKEFYHHIPINDYDFTFNTSFKALSKKLHYANACVDIMQKSALPQSKSIKSVMFFNPAFFFYVEELEELWKLFAGDHNLLKNFLVSRDAFSVLNIMHTYSNVSIFYRDFAKERGSYELCSLLKRYGKVASEYGMHYIAFNDQKRLKERARWNNLSGVRFSNSYNRLMSGISSIDRAFVETSATNREIKDQSHNGYVFTELKTQAQRYLAGEQLNNCLKNTKFSNTIIGVLKNGVYMAAIEVRVNRIVQAYIYDNEPIEENKGIFEAFQKWVKVNDLRYNTKGYQYDYPF